ncbi:MAG: aldehyde ferredoxin oxidoreductase C-terminal domain-containing protein [Sedimentibacter saalensis]|uniref:aldehyde ferredoxin oxidoreductase family protein n=1 Tax=Sedimentibacter saalensis TaxID=130788 RepID=UPI002B1EBCBC|nr:aldehyde ferredoxin oxidoreductase C-terminal domain-containing protein [Sedimentibacter saalensis]MEA5093563.1 aldehyde ferredoxin oxidoreductase C-terminal domain-containing protein [Sedimentibacter saalensis]
MKIYRVNMSKLSFSIEDVPERWNTLGGRGLTSTIISEEVDPACNPLGSKNKLVFAPGLFAGTKAANSGRLSVGAKSPLTGGIKESNSGGTAAQRLAKLGVKALIIEGMPKDDKWYTIHVHKDGVNIKEETELLGKGNYEVVHTITSRYGENTGVMTIGQAGEYKMSTANISVKDPKGHLRSAGRGGLGAVMGSKHIKFISLDDNDGEGIEIKDKKKFDDAAKIFNKGLLKHPVSGEALPKYGSNVLVNILNEAGGLPTKNSRMGRFEGAEKICGETMHDTIVERHGDTTHGCHVGCIIRCSQTYNDKDGSYLTSGFEYETIWGFGAGCMVDDLDVIAHIDHECDDIGIDTIDTAGTMMVAMEAELLKWGDGEGILNLIKSEIKSGTPLGRILGNGPDFTGKAYGVLRVPTVKGQTMPAYDPRAVKGIGVTYATTPMGADHTAGYSVAANILKVGGSVDPLKKEGQTELSRDLQIATASIDSTGLCLFVSFAVLDFDEVFLSVLDMINAQYGVEWTKDDWNNMGKYVLTIEKEFNRKAGFTKNDDRLPEFTSEAIPPHDVVWDISDEELDKVLQF